MEYEESPEISLTALRIDGSSVVSVPTIANLILNSDLSENNLAASIKSKIPFS